MKIIIIGSGAAAETIGAIAAKAATAAHVAFAAVGRALTLSHAKAALTAGVAATANVALAATTKVVAAGYLAASAAATAFCAIPITWVLIGIVAALGGLCAYMASATKHTAQLSDEMGKLRDKSDQLRATDQLRMERLTQLAEKESLSNAEMQEAEKLANQLKGRYGDLGIAIDHASKSISMAADAQSRFNEAMKAQAIHQIEAEINEARKNIRELRDENESLTGFWVNAWNTVTFRMSKAANDIQANGEKISGEMKKIADAQKRLNAIKGGDEDALTGGKTEHEQLEEKVTQGRSEKHAQYLKKMGGIIMIASIVIWFLGYYPNHNAYETVAEQQEHSYIGQIGKAIEPAIEPLGFDWKLGIGLISGVGAKELVVSTLGVLYTNEEDIESVNLSDRIPITPIVALGYMLFVLLYFPCIATIVAIKQESGSWRWAIFAACYTTALAWLVAFVVNQIGNLFVS